MIATIGLLAPLLERVLAAVLPDAEARRQAIAEILSKLAEADAGQLRVNAAEAAHASLFVAGWRPAIGWCCAAALAYQYLFAPLAIWVATAAGRSLGPLPVLDGSLWELMAGMLGLGALRSLEKIRGVAK